MPPTIQKHYHRTAALVLLHSKKCTDLDSSPPPSLYIPSQTSSVNLLPRFPSLSAGLPALAISSLLAFVGLSVQGPPACTVGRRCGPGLSVMASGGSTSALLKNGEVVLSRCVDSMTRWSWLWRGA